MALLFTVGGIGHAPAAALCPACIEITLEHPVVVRGPSENEPDAPLSIIKLPGGTFRGFTANATTIAVDGATPFDLGGSSRVVLKPGPKGSASECGRWLTTVLRGHDVLYGLIHNEQHCNYASGQTYKSMSIGVSHDEGLTWKVLGQIITGDEGFIPGGVGGVGDCTAIDGHDGYWYAYCLRTRDWKNIVARAAEGDPAPGKWREWNGSTWSEPALGGIAAALDPSVGMNAAYWAKTGETLLLNATSTALRLSISKDKVNFKTLPEPLILYQSNNWHRPAPTALYAYPAMIDPAQGFNTITRKFILAYLYVPPGRDFTQRYLVMQEGQIVAARTPRNPQVRTALSRWNGADGVTWTTAGVAISRGRTYAYGARLGYVMTAPPRDLPSVALDECFSAQTGVGFLAKSGGCAAEGSARRRTAGYVFLHERPDTVALFDCAAKNGAHFVSNRPDCEEMGARRSLLGYAMRS